MDNTLANEKSLALSYLALRRIIGLLGFSLPFILSLGALILFQTGIQSSISSYYHTGMGDVFVGILCVIGVFLLAYKGYKKPDNEGYEKPDYIARFLGGVFAVGVALFPITPDDAPEDASRVIGYVHHAFAALFFLTLIYFSLCLFTKTDPNKSPTRRKLQRNKVYKACGYTMAICILLIGVYFLLPGSIATSLEGYNPVFWLESLAVVAFGFSWLTKGEALLKDEV
ncbi:MAG: hypothetical protein V3T53_03690 [Phycisphaerales bacterium]